jgi:hypothetical protein
MNKLLVATIASVTVFSTPTSAAPSGQDAPQRFRDIPDASRNTDPNPEHHRVESTDQRSQSPDAIGQFDDCHFSDAHDIDCE